MGKKTVEFSKIMRTNFIQKKDSINKILDITQSLTQITLLLIFPPLRD